MWSSSTGESVQPVEVEEPQSHETETGLVHSTSSAPKKPRSETSSTTCCLQRRRRDGGIFNRISYRFQLNSEFKLSFSCNKLTCLYALTANSHRGKIDTVIYRDVLLADASVNTEATGSIRYQILFLYVSLLAYIYNSGIRNRQKQLRIIS